MIVNSINPTCLHLKEYLENDDINTCEGYYSNIVQFYTRISKTFKAITI